MTVQMKAIKQFTPVVTLISDKLTKKNNENKNNFLL